MTVIGEVDTRTIAFDKVIDAMMSVMLNINDIEKRLEDNLTSPIT